MYICVNIRIYYIQCLFGVINIQYVICLFFYKYINIKIGKGKEKNKNIFLVI